MGNYATCKKYTQKEKNQFILLTRSHFSLIAKNCVAIGTHTLSYIRLLLYTFNFTKVDPDLDLVFIRHQTQTQCCYLP